MFTPELKFKLFIILVIFAGIIFSSCNEKFTLQPDEFKEKMVIESYIYSDTDSISVKLSKTVNPYKENRGYDSSRLVRNAEVKLNFEGYEFSLGEETGKLLGYDGYPITRTESNYYIKGLNFSKYNECTLTVTKDDQKITAKSIIPSSTKIRNISATLSRIQSDYDPFYNTTISMNIDADFPQKVKNFYRITFLVDYYRNGNIYRLGSTTANYFVFTTDSSEVHLSFYVGNIDKNLEWRNMKLYLDHITEDYYDFQQACKTQRDNDDSIFNTDGTEIPSNVNGGYGIFTFITRDTACINLK